MTTITTINAELAETAEKFLSRIRKTTINTQPRRHEGTKQLCGFFFVTHEIR